MRTSASVGGEHTGQPLSGQIVVIPADDVPLSEGNTDGRANASAWEEPGVGKTLA